MTSRQKSATNHYCTLFQLGAIGDLSDRQLLERFATDQGQTAELAFGALVERHGPMVLHACNALLRNPHDAEDAFQATFMVLLRKSRDLWVHDSLGPWLHRVATRTAARAQALSRRRRECEQQAAQETNFHRGPHHETQNYVLHEEIDRLPETLRVLVVLCHLEGQSQERAARTLLLPLGTVKSRLHRARTRLRARLLRRGLSSSSGLLTPESQTGRAEVVQSLSVSFSMLHAIAQTGVSRTARDHHVSARATQLFQETLKAMFLTRLRIGAALVLLAGVFAWSASTVVAQQGARRPGTDSTTDFTGAPATGKASAGDHRTPAFIRRSRGSIVERLEQELTRAEGQLAGLSARARSTENDAIALHLRKTIEKLSSLLNRIDPVLVDAVEQFPTIFDFTTAPSSRPGAADRLQPGTPDATPSSPKPNTPAAKPAEPAATRHYDQLSLAKAAERMEWARRMNEKGFVSNAERDRYVHEFESLKALIDADIARAADRVDWAKRMLQRGYVTKNQYDMELLRHYDALEARAEGEPHAVTDDLLKRYELLKAKVEKATRKPASDPQRPAEKLPPSRATGTPEAAIKEDANRGRAKVPPPVDAAPAEKPSDVSPQPF